MSQWEVLRRDQVEGAAHRPRPDDLTGVHAASTSARVPTAVRRRPTAAQVLALDGGQRLPRSTWPAAAGDPLGDQPQQRDLVRGAHCSTVPGAYDTAR